MSAYDVMEAKGRQPMSIWLARLRALAVVALCGAMMAATYKATINLLDWRGSSELARTIAVDATQSKLTRVNAHDAIYHDALASIAILREIAAQDDDEGRRAQVMLDDLAAFAHR